MTTALQNVRRLSIISVSDRQQQKQDAQQKLEEAMVIGSEERLLQAVRDGVDAGLDAQELRRTRDALAKIRQQDGARQAIANAIQRGTEKCLEAAVARGQRAGLSDEAGGQLREAQQLLACLKKGVLRRSCVEALALINSRRLPPGARRSCDGDGDLEGAWIDLRAAVDSADRFGMDAEEIDEARHALRQRALSQALAEIRNRDMSIKQWQSKIETLDVARYAGYLDLPDMQAHKNFIVMWQCAVDNRSVSALQACVKEGDRLLVPNQFLSVAKRALAEQIQRLIQEAAATAASLPKPENDGQDVCAICLEGGALMAMPCCSRQSTSNLLHFACMSGLSRCPFCRGTI